MLVFDIHLANIYIFDRQYNQMLSQSFSFTVVTPLLDNVSVTLAMLVQNVTSLALLVPMAMDAIRYVNVRMELIVTLSMEFVRVRLDGWGKCEYFH